MDRVWGHKNLLSPSCDCTRFNEKDFLLFCCVEIPVAQWNLNNRVLKRANFIIFTCYIKIRETEGEKSARSERPNIGL
jgi:hypothetical protein